MTPRITSRRRRVTRFAAVLRQVSLLETWRTLVKDLFDPYRPELHYMRGPGPKWREKHQPALVRVPAHAEPILAPVTI
jgi:hypothetical protein